MSDTPRTDEAELSFLDIQNGHGTSPYVSAEIARQFERELNEQRQIAQKYEDRYFNLLGMFQKLLERNITFDCNNAVLHFESHDQAINHIAEARRYGR